MKKFKNGRDNMDKKEKQPSFFSELGQFMKPYKGRYAISILISILSVGSSILAYVFMGKIASMLFGTNIVFNKVLQLVFTVIAFKITSVLCLNLSTYISHTAAYLTLRDIRNALSEKMLKLNVGYFEENGKGRLKTIMVDHIENIEKTLAHMLPELTANILGPLCCIVWMFFIDWRISLITIIWVILGFSVTIGMTKNYSEKYQGQIAVKKAMNQSVVEYVNGIEVIKNFGRVDESYEKYQNAVYDYAKYNVNWQKEVQKYSSLGMAIAPFSVFPILISGLFFFGNGTIEAGTLFLMIILSFGIFGPLMNAMSYFDQFAAMGTNAKEIKDVLDQKELKRSDIKVGENLDIKYENVSFAYNKEDKEVLKDINIDIKEGTMFALVGPSGSGKSTIAKLLAGFWDVTKGKITIGNIPINDLSQEELNRLIAYVEQDTFLFDKTIEENIKISNPNASLEEVIEVSKKAGCDEFISELPEGYKTNVGNAGDKLSGGEKQRIAIVRAKMKNSPIMILDEATASTDPENEASIQRALSVAAKGKTLIVVAHRLATIMHADKIAYVEDGKIKAVGNHEELLEKCPEYKNMWNLAEVR